MNESSSQEINAIRLRFLDLLKSFFDREPDEIRVQTWSKVVKSLASEKINPTMDSAVQELESLLNSMSLDDINKEYYELFTDPFSQHIVRTTLSSYVDGHDFGQSLVELRKFLINTGVVKIAEVEESEDSLIFLLDILATLIADEKNIPEECLENESELLNRFLEPFTGYFHKAMQNNEKAHFYTACTKFLAGYIDLEKGLMTPA